MGVKKKGDGSVTKEISQKIEKAKNDFSEKEFRNYGNLSKEEVIIYAERKAWKDLFMIHVPRISNITSNNKEDILKQMKDMFLKYLDGNDKRDFEDIHKDMCHIFLKLLARYMKVSEEYTNALYGKAQKFVNMTFKYLYVTKQFEDKIDLFDGCHMPIDKYILRWFYRETGIYLEGWSFIDKEVYYVMQEKIKVMVPEGYSSLQYEFVIWEELKNTERDLKKMNKEELEMLLK